MKFSGRKLREARLRSSLSQSEVAERLVVTQATVSNWEIGRSAPSDRQARAIGRFLDLSTRAAKKGAPTPSEVSAFGAWLNKTRIEKRMTVTELSRESGVSAPAIYNIESGRIDNPRESTRGALSKALEVDVPDDTVRETEDASRITGLGSLKDFDPHNDADLPPEPGIYVFYDISRRPIYVGQGGSIAKRVSDHKDKFWFKSPIVETASFIVIPNKQLRLQVEQVLINFLKSNAVINQKHVERD